MSARSRFAPLAGLLLLAAVLSAPSALGPFGISWVGATAVAQPQQPPKAQKAPDTAAILPRDTAGFVSVNVAKLWDHKAFLPIREARGKFEFAWLVQSFLGISPNDIDRLVVFWKTPDKPFVLVTGRKAVDPKAVVEAIARPNSTPPAKPADPRVMVAAGAEFAYVARVNDRTLLLAPASADPAEVVKWIDQPPAIDTAGKHDVMITVDVKSLADLPLPVGAPLLEAKTAVLSADIANKDKATAELTLAFPTADRAKAAAPILRAKLDELAGWAKQQEKKSYEKANDSGSMPGPMLDWLATNLKAAKVRVEGSNLIASAEFEPSDAVTRALMAAPDAALADRGSSSAANNLKQIALAVHNYHDANGHCPSNTYDKDGKPLLSWRVHILPYIEQGALYNQFKLDEPWDSPNNLPLSKVVIRTYTIPGRFAEPGMTYFQSFIQPKDAKEDARPWLVEGQNKGPQLQAVSDGTSNTIMVAEATKGVIWSKPDDLVYSDKKPVPQLGGPSGRYTVAFGDGSVRTFRRGQVNDVTLRRLITINDGEAVAIPR